MGYNNKILVSDGTFSLGENDKVNTLELVKEVDKPKSHEAVVRPTITHKDSQKQTITQAGGFAIWCMFQLNPCSRTRALNLSENGHVVILLIDFTYAIKNTMFFENSQIGKHFPLESVFGLGFGFKIVWSRLGLQTWRLGRDLGRDQTGPNSCQFESSE